MWALTHQCFVFVMFSDSTFFWDRHAFVDLKRCQDSIIWSVRCWIDEEKNATIFFSSTTVHRVFEIVDRSDLVLRHFFSLQTRGNGSVGKNEAIAEANAELAEFVMSYFLLGSSQAYTNRRKLRRNINWI